MPRFAAFLRGVSPLNATMPELKAAFEVAGFTEVKTVLSSGNVVFSAPRKSEAALQREAEAAMRKRLRHEFLTIVRPIDALRELIASDPYEPFASVPEAKRVVTLLRGTAPANIKLPIERDGVRILTIKAREVFTDYVATPKGAVFMALIEKTFGKEVTTRTWDTVVKVAR